MTRSGMECFCSAKRQPGFIMAAIHSVYTFLNLKMLSFLKSKWILALLWIVGMLYAIVVVLITGGWFPWNVEQPSVRLILWLIGGAELVAVTIRWLVVSASQNPPAKEPCDLHEGGEGTSNPDKVRNDAAKNGTSGTPTVGRDQPRLEKIIAWLFSYPLFPIEIAVLIAVSWLGFGSGMGFPDLLWDEFWVWTFFNGLSISLLFANAFIIRYMLDRRPGSPRIINPNRHHWLNRFSLFKFTNDDETTRLGVYLFVWWLPALGLFFIPKLFCGYLQYLSWDLPAMFGGLVVGVFLTRLMVYLTWYTRSGNTNEQFQRLSLWLFAVPGIILVFFLIANQFGVIWHPIWVICLILGLFNSIYGFVVFRFAGLQYVLLILYVLIGVICNTQHPDKMSFPELDSKNLVDLDSLEKNEQDFDNLNLVKSSKMLKNFHETKWAEGLGKSGKDPKDCKPKLVIVANSGGGIRAAVWTAVVLEGLEEVMAGDPKKGEAAFRDHIRLMTGASGGMLGAGLYVADFETPPDKKPRKLSDLLAKDSLWPTIQTMMLHDLPAISVPWNLDRDRGRSLENAWVENTRPHKDVPLGRLQSNLNLDAPPQSPLEKSFDQLRAWGDNNKFSEENCDRPSLVFSPMLVEDCRRLLITNLDLGAKLGGIPTLTCANLDTPPSQFNPPLPDIPEDRLSVPAIEFWRAFPQAYKKFQLKTAARMSATFPFVGPGISLPTSPRRRVVDAGYFDNFGINLAAAWVWLYREEIKQHTSGVVIVEIRAYPRRLEKLLVDPTKANKDNTSSDGIKPLKKPESFSWALTEVSTPAEAIVNLYSRGAYFRNDFLLHILDKHFNGESPKTKREERLFTTVTFECNLDAALSWTLPHYEFEEIKRYFQNSTYELNELKRWFGAGGTK
jgi:hypothetical protein